MIVPDRVSANARGTPEGVVWLDRLPETVGELSRRWSLTVGSPFDGPEATAAWVATARRADGTSVVLKIGLPHMEAEHEIDGLRFWNGDPTVSILESDDHLGAMLLERCDPGTTLRLLPESEQDQVIARLLRRLWRSPTPPHPFRPLSVMTAYWIEESMADRARWPDAGLVREGLRLFEELARPADGGRDVLLATDLHAGNVLRAQREPWLVIDPKPFVGDPAYDATQHLLNTERRLRERPLETIARFADLLELDGERVRSWSFARAAAEPRDDWDEASMDLARALARRLDRYGLPGGLMTESAWRRRFRATELGLPSWSALAPQRLAFVSNERGVRQVWALDRATGERRQVSNEGSGVEQALLSPDGRIVWWSGSRGNERGRWVAVPFEGGIPSPLVPGVDDNWSMGISLVGNSVAIGQATDNDFRIYVAEDGASARLLYRHDQPAGVGRLWPEGTGGLSSDASLLCVRHTERGDILHSSLRVLETAGGAAIGELEDPGRSLDPVAWSPRTPTLLFTSERGAFERPAIWDLSTGERWDLEVDLPGAVIPITWYPDGEGILVRQEHEAIDRLHRIDVRTRDAEMIAQPRGEIEDAVVRPDGEVWLTVSNTSHPRRPETADGRAVLEAPGDPPPSGRPYRFFWFDNPARERIQAFVVSPDGNGPFPIVIHPHGGPEWHHRDRWEPEIQALVDAGYAVAGVNYRGSTGYGIAFRERLIGDPLFPESEDLMACLDALVAEGVADPNDSFFAGWSWGGWLACLNEGLHPDRWSAVFAGVPAGDIVAAHWAGMPLIRALNVATFGGDPDEVPELFRERNPMTYVGRAKAPVLVIAGEQDPRCPLEGVTPWVEALQELGVGVELFLYPTGHNVNDKEADIRYTELILDFFERHRGARKAER